MESQLNRNRGFSLVELLISMALLSIIMLMVVQFMSSTAGANKRTKDNLRAQTEAKEVMTNISDNLMGASFIRISPYDNGAYVMPSNSGKRKESIDTAISNSITDDKGNTVEYDFVPDNYGNYVRKNKATTDERKVIVDMKTYQLPGEKKDTFYPLSDDLDTGVLNAATGTTQDVRSFRALKQDITGSGKNTYIYIKPQYIYAEYKENSGRIHTVIYRFDYDGSGKSKIYVYRSPSTITYTEESDGRYADAANEVDALSGNEGLLSDHLTDFFVSADADGNALLFDALFDVKGYLYNSTDTLTFRNTEVLTVRPQNLYKKYYKDNSSEEASSTENSSSEEASEESSGTTP